MSQFYYKHVFTPASEGVDEKSMIVSFNTDKVLDTYTLSNGNVRVRMDDWHQEYKKNFREKRNNKGEVKPEEFWRDTDATSEHILPEEDGKRFRALTENPHYSPEWKAFGEEIEHPKSHKESLEEFMEKHVDVLEK